MTDTNLSEKSSKSHKFISLLTEISVILLMNKSLIL